MTTVNDKRESQIHRVIGTEIPRLWCPPLTHYTGDGAIDTERMATHWRTMRDQVGGFLVPGTTGDGWEMSEKEIATLLEVAVALATDLDIRLLVGVLRTETDAMIEVINDTMAWLKATTGEDDSLAAMTRCNVAGFTVCPPKGSELTQAQIQTALEQVLDLDLPIALYQLPQITENEISAAVFQDLASRYPNLLLLKDTSGQDHVPLAIRDADQGPGWVRGDVFLVRGAEGDYAQWLREAGGPYDGLLLSTANCFANQLGEVIARLDRHDIAGAKALSRSLTAVINAAFAAVADVEVGNAFTNANKALDHVMAHGSGAADVPPPVLHAGVRLPHAVIEQAVRILTEAGMMPDHGYVS
jgi:dihydrodipicolinate synthase/N-acetylneuraminate lyase